MSQYIVWNTEVVYERQGFLSMLTHINTLAHFMHAALCAPLITNSPESFSGVVLGLNLV